MATCKNPQENLNLSTSTNGFNVHVLEEHELELRAKI